MKSLVLGGLLLAPLAAMSADIAPPKAPEREKGELTSASAVALDAAKAVSFLEQGQVYYKAYAKGSHTADQNKAFVRFAEDYDREMATVKKELEVLQTWMEKKAELKPD